MMAALVCPETRDDDVIGQGSTVGHMEDPWQPTQHGKDNLQDVRN